MLVDTVILFLALLAVLCQIFIATVVVTRLAAARSAGARRFYERIVANVGGLALPFAFVVALVTALGSLFLSEIAHYTPCRLCWYQRIALYPLVPVLGLAAWRREVWIWRYGVLLAALCVPISIYHATLERFPSLAGTTCDPTAPCTAIWFEKFGYLTIPVMAGIAALTIITLLLLARSAASTEQPTQPE